jgi:glycosyltransferase involved in cell wall biosynthesis
MSARSDTSVVRQRPSTKGELPDVKLPITVLVAAKNEEPNIGRCLSHLGPASKVILLDSNSQDRTAEIAAEMGAEVVQFKYSGGYPKKRQWALDNLRLATDWILLLDADEVVPPELWSEIAQAIHKNGPTAYLITKSFHFLGRRFRYGGLSHAAVLLFRRGRARFEELLVDRADAQDMEVHERLLVEGRTSALATPLIHQDFKGLEAYIARHNLYSSWEARLRHSFMESGSYGASSVRPRLFGDVQERRRFLKRIAIRTPFEPFWWFIYHYFVRLGVLEGMPGLIACQIRASYVSQVRAKIYELRKQNRQALARNSEAISDAPARTLQ